MFTFIVVAVLALFLFFYVAIPLIFPKQADKLPSNNDPITTELKEEKEALFRAILELESRKDLPTERRDALKMRYEAKAAKVLQALDERQTQPQEAPTTPKTKQRSFPYAILGLLVVMITSATIMGGYVLPRLGLDTTVTAFSEEEIEAGLELKKLQRAVSNDPSIENQLALAEAHWAISRDFQNEQQFQDAIKIYESLVGQHENLPAIVYFRLGLTQLQDKPDKALANFDKARKLKPSNPEILSTLGEIYLSLGNLENTVELWQSYLDTSEGAKDEATKERLATVKSLVSKNEIVQENPNENNLMDIANDFWDLEQRYLAEYFYARVIKEYNSENILALSRLGQAMFTSGDAENAIVLLARAREQEKKQTSPNLKTLLFLGNAYFSLENYADAITVWEEYIEIAGGEESAGRVPSLIVQARARLEGNQKEPLVNNGQRLYQANCAACHGISGGGGSAPRLQGNRRLANEARVTAIITNGKGFMPAFGSILSTEEVNSIAKFVIEEIVSQ